MMPPSRTLPKVGPGAAAMSLAAWVAVALMPKCPLCVAVLLTSLGVGAAWATPLAPVLRAGTWSVAVTALAIAVWAQRRRLVARRAAQREPTRMDCCG